MLYYRVLNVQQSKFNADGSPPDPTYQCIVSVTIGTATDPNKHSFLLESADKEVRLDGVSADECLSLNPGYRGFYRVQYSAEMLNIILEQVKKLKLTPSDRLGLHNDLYAQVCGIGILESFVYFRLHGLKQGLSNYGKIFGSRIVCG